MWNAFSDLFPRTSPHALRTLWREDRAGFWYAALFWTFWLSLASFPIGYGAREVLPPLCAIFLFCYYRHAWSRSVWRRLTLRPLFYCLWAMIALGVLFSGDMLSSLLHAGTGINKGFILPIIGMECVRDGRDLRRLVAACIVACFWEGMDGIWQAWTGYDFIMNYPLNSGRLTGSLGDYSVGNYIALAIIPALGGWHMLRRHAGPAKSLAVCAVLLAPAFFLLQGASSRSGILAVASAFGFWWLLSRQRLNILPLAGGAGVMLGYAFLQASRLDPETVANDGRWSLWELGWKVFCEHPFFGAGAGQYNAAFRELGLAPARDAITISHPHNLYLDILYAHGIVGFLLGMAFLAGFAWWGYVRIRRQLALRPRDDGGRLYWALAGWFWVGYMGWLVNGIFGHDFYRIWWLALAMTYLGIFIGAIVNGEDPPVARALPSGEGRGGSDAAE